MNHALLEEVINTLLLFAMEAYEHEGEPDEALVTHSHTVTVKSFRRARDLVKKLEKLREDKKYFANETMIKKKIREAHIINDLVESEEK